jgi:hypothetical protein
MLPGTGPLAGCVNFAASLARWECSIGKAQSVRVVRAKFAVALVIGCARSACPSQGRGSPVSSLAHASMMTPLSGSLCSTFSKPRSFSKLWSSRDQKGQLDGVTDSEPPVASVHKLPDVWAAFSSIGAAWKATGPTLSLGDYVWGMQV